MGAGTENRMWAPPPAPFQPRPIPYKLNITEHVKITMRDGVKLDALLYVPVRISLRAASWLPTVMAGAIRVTGGSPNRMAMRF